MQDIASPQVHTAANLPAQAISEEVLLEKYAKGDERSIDAVNRRVARALAQAEPADQRVLWEERFAEALRLRLRAGRAHPVGRRHQLVGHADQLLRAAGRRLDRAR